MFDFFKKLGKKREAQKAKSALVQKIMADFENGRGNALEIALILHLSEENQESLCHLLVNFGGSDVFILTKGNKRLSDAAITTHAGDIPYVAAFTSRERALSEAKNWGPFDKAVEIPAMELVFGLPGVVGIVLNPNDEHLRWAFSPEQTSNLKTVFESSFKFQVGGLYSVWSQDSYKVIKLLQADDGGVHIRTYANKWSERPKELEQAQLTMTGENHDAVESIGHLPLTRACFLSMGPKLIVTGSVHEDELDGYKMWKEAKGGYFDV